MVKKRSKIFEMRWGGMPVPVSVKVMWTWLAVVVRVMVSSLRLVVSMAWQAFRIRFTKTDWISSVLARMVAEWSLGLIWHFLIWGWRVSRVSSRSFFRSTGSSVSEPGRARFRRLRARRLAFLSQS